MTEINFPNSPIINDIHEENNLKWIWTGVTWDIFIELDKTPVDRKYINQADMIADQSDQISGYIYYISSEDIYYEFLGTFLNDITDYKIIGGLGKFVPYSGATTNVDLGSFIITANAIIKNGGLDTQFLKADGTVDNNNYLTANDLPSTLSLYATNVPSDVIGYFKLVTTIDDPDYNTTPVDIPTGAITTPNQLIASLVSPPNLINGNPGVFNVTTTGNIRKISGSGNAEFYFEIYKRESTGIETFVGISSNTIPVVNSGYAEFFATAIWNDGIFGVTDTIVLKFYGSRISGGSNPTYQFQFGGEQPVRTLVPIPIAVIPNIFLGDLADVEDGVASNNDGIFWDSTNLIWKYKSISEALGYTPISLNSLLTGYTVGPNTAITSSNTILTAFEQVQGQINARISGTIVAGQVAFGTATNTVGGDNDFIYNSITNLLTLVGSITLVGSQIIQTSTGNLTLATSGGNGNIILSTYGTGKIGIGITLPLAKLHVNGDILVGTRANATGNFATYSATGVLQERTASEVLSDISAVPTSRTLTFTTNNGLTGGNSAVDLSIDRLFTFGLTGQALALHNLNTNGIIVRTSAGNVTTRSIAAGTGISITNGDGIAGNPTINTTITQYTDALVRTAISLTTSGNSGVSTYNNTTGVFNIPNYSLAGLGGEPSFTKGNIIQGDGILLAGTLTSRLVGTGNITISHLDTSTQSTITNSNGNVIQSITLDTYGHITLLNSIDLDTRYYTQTQVNNNLTNYQLLSQKAQANGYSPLDASSKIPLIHLPDSILGQVKYMGTWNANTNTPTLALSPASTTKGEYYVVSAAGIFSGLDFNIGDWVISNGISWEKVDNTDAVTAVFGRVGNILAISSDYESFYVRHDINNQGLNTTQQGNARTNINAQITITGAATTVTTANLTINRALISDSSGKIAVSSVSSTELGYLAGVTSSIQTQLNSKLTANQSITLSGDVTGTGNTAITTTISNNVITDTKLRQSVPYSIIGRTGSTTGNVADIIAGSNGVLRRDGTGDLIFSTLVTGNIGDSQITYSKIQNITADRILGRITTNGVVQELTSTQIRTLINVQEGANLYTHPTYTAINQNLSGATVLASIITDTIGSVTTITTRSLTAADISAVPTSRTLTFTTNNGLTGGSAAVDLSINRSFTFGLTGQALALHNLSTNGIIVRTGANTVTTRTLTAGSNIDITNGDGVAGNPTISLADSTYSFDEETFTYTGSTNFTLSVTTPFAVQVFLNGQRLVKTLDWTIAGNVVTVSLPLDTSNPDEIVITYFYNTPDVVLPGLTGSGTTNFVSKWSNSSGLTSSIIFDNGTNVGIGTSSPVAKLHIGGSVLISTITNATGDFVTTSVTGILQKRTAAEVLADIGAGSSTADITAVSLTTTTLTLTRAAGNLTASVPTFNQNTTGTAANVTGTVLVANGGTGAITHTSGNVLIGAGTSAITSLSRSGIDTRSTFPPSQHAISTHSATAWRMFFSNATTTAIQELAFGTIGQYLRSGGATANPSWSTILYSEISGTPTIPTVNDGTLNLGVSGVGLSGTASFTANQSGTSTFTVTSNATSANTINTIVSRDASGNFTAGTITAALSGNASTSTLLQTARTLTIGSTGKTFNGGANVSWTLAEIGAQAALTNPVTGTGTTNFLSKFTGASTLGNSTIFDNGTNVGIGTSSPNSKLDIFGQQASGATDFTKVSVLRLTRDIAFISGRFPKDSIVDFIVSRYEDPNNFPRTQLDFKLNGLTDNDTPDIDVMTLRSNGNVGIGTTAPTAKLDVDGGIRLSNSNRVEGRAFPFTTNIGSGADATTTFLDAGSTNSFLSRIVLAGGSATNPNTIQLITASSERMRIDSAGNVGIGTTAPTEKLEVSGNLRLSNIILSNQQNLDVDSGSLRVISTLASGTYDAVFFDFVIKKGTNLRSGTVYAVHNGTTVEFTETSTADLGSTTEVILSCDILSGNIRLLASTTTNDWIIKTLVRGI